MRPSRIADLEPRSSQQQRQALAGKNPVRANRKRTSDDCQLGNEVLLLTCKPDRLEPRAAGPRTTHLVRASGAAMISGNPGVRERLSTRRLRPCFRERVKQEGFILMQQGSFGLTFLCDFSRFGLIPTGGQSVLS